MVPVSPSWPLSVTIRITRSLTGGDIDDTPLELSDLLQPRLREGVQAIVDDLDVL